MESTWKIINEEKGKTKNDTDVKPLVINNNVIMNQNKIANIFKDYFLPAKLSRYRPGVAQRVPGS
jgi:hypothetical protein